MPWIRFAPPLRRIVALALFATAGLAAAESLVVRSSGPSAKSYPPGKALADNSRIVLKANDQLVILDGRGTRTLKGPGTFAVNAPAQASDSRSTFAALVTQRNARRARTGAVRQPGKGADGVREMMVRSPNIWFVDIERSSTVCVADPAAVTLWRPDADKAATITLTRTADGKTAAIAFEQGQSSSPWPAGMPIAGGAGYRIKWPGATQPTLLTFALLGPNPQGLEDMAAALIRNKCEAQLDLLIETVAVPETETPPAG